jgi:diaminopimelate decarboxylase
VKKFSFKPHFGIDERGNLVIGEVSAPELAKKFGTPLYVVDEQRMREKYRRFFTAYSSRWKNVELYYAYKANSNLAVCKVLQTEGAGAEVSSGNELRTAKRLGIPGERIIFNGNNKRPEELELAVNHGALVNVDNLQELELMGKIASKRGKRARIGFRINPDVKAPTHPYVATGLKESKFGFDVSSGQAFEAYQKAKELKNVEVVGIHCHIGSQILDSSPFKEEAERVMAVVVELKEKLGIDLKYVDFGGGIGIPYEPEERELQPAEVASKVVPVIEREVKDHGLVPPTLVDEPGRYLVADSSILLLTVGYTKSRPGLPDWISVDAGMNALIRPALYGAYHHIEVASRMNEPHDHLYNVTGPICESGDFLGKKRKLPETKPGDLVAVFDVGAYGIGLSSQHTAQSRPAMVLVNSGRAEVIRERETYEDLVRLDRIPEWLESSA